MYNESFLFHDWDLDTILINWHERSIRIKVSGDNKGGEIIAYKFSDLTVPRFQEWGPSVSIYTTYGPDKCGENEYIFNIQMQTGDVISITAASIEMPSTD